MKQVVVCICWLATACAVPVALPSGAVAFDPPEVYRTWWTMVEACSGVSGSFAHLGWYRATASAVEARGGKDVEAYYDYTAKRVVVAEEAVYAGRTIRHEMLHALRGQPGHPARVFLDACGGVVACAGACIAAAGERAPQEVARLLPAESLFVELTLDPPMPSPTIDNGHFRVIARVRNPYPEAIRATEADGFTLELVRDGQRLGGSVSSADPRITAFEAGEVKQMVFDLGLGLPRPRLQLYPGVYQVRVAFGSLWSAPSTLTLFR